jgi:hypothetical protein
MMVVALVCIGGTASVAQAQGGGGGMGGMGGGRGGQRMSQIDRALNGITLNADQQKKVDDIKAAQQKEMEDMRGQMQGGDRSEMMQKMRDMNQKYLKQVRDVLTADQQAAFDKNVEEMQQRMRPPGGGL